MRVINNISLIRTWHGAFCFKIKLRDARKRIQAVFSLHDRVTLLLPSSSYITFIYKHKRNKNMIRSTSLSFIFSKEWAGYFNIIALTSILLYTKQPIFHAVQVVSYTSACTKLPGDKCMHHYTKLSKKPPALNLDVK